MPGPIRCAIYTRKSSDEGLEQNYNSLDAQRDACAAYVMSQAGEGWVLLPGSFDDGGFSGGSMERPGLQRLLVDIRARRVDVVIVYKVDRLTRSLADFARIVEILDQSDASFVSVTQAFNTTTSMGRLTLNVLLSFAQFEREVTGERIRDKIAASKARGMWMGGIPPLGYDLPAPGTRALVVNDAESKQVRMIFRKYLELGSVNVLGEALAGEGIVSKRRVARTGRESGGGPLGRGALYHLLRNSLYLGEIRHKGVTYPGQHSAIVPRDLFEAVQKALAAGDAPANCRRSDDGPAVPLTGILYDGDGARMSPVRARKAGGPAYRYYVSQSLITGRSKTAPDARRVNAVQLERQVYGLLAALDLVSRDGAEPDWPTALAVLQRVVLRGDRLAVTLATTPKVVTIVADAQALRARLGADVEVRQERPDGGGAATGITGAAHDSITLITRFTAIRRSGASGAFGPAGEGAIAKVQRDAVLAGALIRAEACKRRVLSGEITNLETIALTERVTGPYVTRLMRLAFLAPGLKRQILEGRQPPGLTLQRLMTAPIPLAWADQQAIYRS